MYMLIILFTVVQQILSKLFIIELTLGVFNSDSFQNFIPFPSGTNIICKILLICTYVCMYISSYKFVCMLYVHIFVYVFSVINYITCYNLW